MDQFRIITPTSAQEIDDYYRIRYEILRKPWNQPSSSTKDETENQSVHILVKNSADESVASGRLQINSVDEAQIRSMAVCEKYQSKGIGSLMLKHLEMIAREKRIKTLLLDSRENAVKFYEQNGFKVVKPSYLLFGIIRHFQMSKDLT